MWDFPIKKKKKEGRGEVRDRRGGRNGKEK